MSNEDLRDLVSRDELTPLLGSNDQQLPKYPRLPVVVSRNGWARISVGLEHRDPCGFRYKHLEPFARRPPDLIQVSSLSAIVRLRLNGLQVDDTFYVTARSITRLTMRVVDVDAVKAIVQTDGRRPVSVCGGLIA